MTSLEVRNYFVFAPIAENKVVRDTYIDSNNEELVSHFALKMPECHCPRSHTCLFFSYMCPGFVFYETEKGLEREHISNYRTFPFPIFPVSAGHRGELWRYSIPFDLPIPNLLFYLPIISYLSPVKVIDYDPSIDLTQEMCLWSNKPLSITSIVLCHDQKFVARTSVVIKISDLLDNGQYFLTDRITELSEKLSSSSSATEMQYFAHCDFLDVFDISKIRFVEKERYERKGPIIVIEPPKKPFKPIR